MHIAVVGSGIAGLSAAWALSAHHNVTLFEASDRIGGHSRTLSICTAEGVDVDVDTGFIVFNERNYPNLTALFDLLEVDTYDSDMSFSVWDPEDRFAYAGRASGLFPSPAAFFDRRRWDIARGLALFRREQQILADGAVPADVTIGSYLAARGYPEAFVESYLMPLASAVWSGTRNRSAEMPAATFLRFLDNHGLVGLTDRPQWRTVRGGARAYVDKVVKEITTVHPGRGVVGVGRNDSDVTLTDIHGVSESFDQVVFATHADVTLRILGEYATPAERSLLGAFAYDTNEVVLHSDASILPTQRRLWSSWNAVGSISGDDPVGVTYWMNKLQDLPTEEDLFVTLNPGGTIADDAVIDRWVTTHPQFTVDTDRAQPQIRALQGRNRTWFAGAYLGHGFHEDGAASGFSVAAKLGSPPPWQPQPDPVADGVNVGASNV